MKYKGPAKPIPTQREPLSDRALAIWLIVLAVIFILFLVLE